METAPHVSQAIEQIRAGDVVLSRSENDPEGAVAGKVVEEVFVRVSPLLRLRVGGRTVRVTPEHPFYALGRGWVAAGLLEVGDRLHTLEGTWRPLEEKEDGGEVATVYNFRVSDYHTYFVGDLSWEFALWTHNTHNVPSGPEGTAPNGGTEVPGSTGAAAQQEFGSQFKGVIEMGPEGTRATAGPINGPAHSSIAVDNLGKITSLDQARFAFSVFGRRLFVQGASSLGTKPTVADIPAIRAALQQRGFLTGIDEATIFIEGAGPHNLLTGQPLGQ